jgi:hypothetical protein
MRLKLQWALPIAQMALAVIFLRLSFLWHIATRMQDMPGPHPASVLLMCLNLPLSPVLNRILDLPPTLWRDGTVVVAIGILWYWVGLKIHRCKERKTLFPVAWEHLRIQVDLLVIGMAGGLGWLLAEVAKDSTPLSRSFLGWWFAPICASLLFWTLGPMFVFGNDLIRCLRQR